MEDSLEHFIKLTRNTKEYHKNQSQVSTPSKPKTITTVKRTECESRAAKIAEFLIEGKLRPEVFLRCLKHIDQAYYQDVVEERAISKICGYALCDNKIPTMPNKQYFIDSRKNKVYDLTDRKNYCCNFCYRASRHIKQQIDNSPLWLRKKDEFPKFILLADTERGCPGEEINQGIVKPAQESSFTSISSFAEVSLEDLSNDEIKSRGKRKFEKIPTLETVNETEELTETIKSVEVANTSTKPNMADKLLTKPNSSQTKKEQKHSKRKKDHKKIFDIIKKHVHEWMTLETYIFLYGEAQMKLHIDENQLQQYFSNLKLAESSLTQQKKYMQICKKLHLNQLVEDSFDKSVLGFKIKPVPDYKELKNESQNLKLKVNSFYKGESYAIDQVTAKTPSIDDVPQETEDNTVENPAVLPLVDVNSQNAIRRKIYLNSVSKVMLALSKGLHIPSNHILEELNLLVKTFSLKPHNVVFEPFLWSLIALILLKMLSIRDDNLKEQLDSKQSNMFINAMLNHLPDVNIFFQELFASITNIELFLERYFCNEG